MSYLFLSMLAYVWNAQVLKHGEGRGQQRLVVIGCNYICATLIAGAMWWLEGGQMPSPVTWVLGTSGGFFYATGLLLWMLALAPLGLGISTATMRLSVICPILLSLLAFAERPHAAQWAGVALTIGVLGFLGWHAMRGTLRVGAQKGHAPGGRDLRLLVLLFVTMGGVGVVQKLFVEWGQPSDRNALLTLIFFSAGVFTWATVVWRRTPLHWRDALRGAVFGVGNIVTNAFLLLGLERVPGVVAFPLVNTGVIVLTTASGALLWRERPGRTGLITVAAATLAIVLLTV